MALNFPSSPSEGQVYLAPGGKVRYRYTSGAWLAESWGTALPFNYLVNGGMGISWENGDNAGTGSAYLPADQWYVVRSAVGGINSWRLAGLTPKGQGYRIHTAVTTAVPTLAAGDYLGLLQYIEGSRIADFRWGTGWAKRAVLRLGFIGKQGTYSIALRAAQSSHYYADAFTISSAQQDTFTEQVFSIPGPTVGTWPIDTTKACELWVTYAAGSNLVGTPRAWTAGNLIASTGQTNGFATTAFTFGVCDVGLYIDPNVTGRAPPWAGLSYREERFHCGRYFQKGPWNEGIANSSTAGPMRFGSIAMSPMRVAPTTAVVGTINVSDIGAGLTVASVAGAYTNPWGIFEQDCNTTAAGHVLGRAVVQGSTGYFTYNARL